MIIEKERFFELFNNIVFWSDKSDLIEKIAKYPWRYVWLFRPTKPKTKIFQNLSQSHEIRFWDALEEVIEEIAQNKWYTILGKHNISYNWETIDIDQLFCSKDWSTIYMVEQKVRDDHDSTKKRWQIDNFEKKLNYIIDTYGHKYKKIFCIMYFIDPSLDKNKKFYEEEIGRMKNIYWNNLLLLYWQDFFDLIFGDGAWKELENLLKERKNSLQDFPIVDYEDNPEESLWILVNIDFSVMRKFIMNDDLRDEWIVKVLFKNWNVLKELSNYYISIWKYKDEDKYLNLWIYLKEKINLFYK